MSFLSQNNSAEAVAKRGSRIVRIAYRPFHHPAPRWNPTDLGRGYAHIWELSSPPALGDRVVLDHYSGQPAVIVGFGTGYQGDFNYVYRRATARELQVAQEKLVANEAAWIALVRSAAGLTSQRMRRRPTPGFPKVAAATPARATEQEAYEAVQMWRRALEYAKGDGWPKSECLKLEQIVSDWMTVKVAGGNF
ncbi:hypothetical protein NQ152_09830 [Microbacterium sp. zg.B48]|uniref:hypothetical protein n=1 Tax=Microbacterium sp. zg.B48 TaxID=2969408 RepID=UPI00214CF510|nr:hypothetical protein [Microbacterium sp. zg.B48]MCR2763805.1 hypothetical protein [Microbacterium sp. zg.B48]